MNARNPFKAYQQTQVTTAKPEKILLMLYEGAIKFVKIANARMRAKDIAGKGTYISKTLAIINELMNTLDHEVGGQLAQDLENLYMFMQDKLIEANLHNRVEDLETVERLLTTLYTAWEDVVNNPRPDGVPSPKLQPDLYAMYAQAQTAPPTVSAPPASKPTASQVILTSQRK
jgi:flagellar secretion chaperone FliS